jgi:RNA 2',3'-cyclic 3'-phosphodiesterase
MRRVRTFLAVEMPSGVIRQSRKLIHQLAEIDSGVRWVSDDTMHITLQFLGDIEELEVAEVCARTIAAVEDLPAFGMQIEGIGAFPNLDRPRTIWGGVGEGIEELRAVQLEIEESLNEMRFPREKRQYQPHVTLGRVRNNHGLDEVRAVLEELSDYNFGPASVDEVIVFSSERTSAGPVYTRMGTAELA